MGLMRFQLYYGISRKDDSDGARDMEWNIWGVPSSRNPIPDPSVQGYPTPTAAQEYGPTTDMSLQYDGPTMSMPPGFGPTADRGGTPDMEWKHHQPYTSDLPSSRNPISDPSFQGYFTPSAAQGYGPTTDMSLQYDGPTMSMPPGFGPTADRGGTPDMEWKHHQPYPSGVPSSRNPIPDPSVQGYSTPSAAQGCRPTTDMSLQYDGPTMSMPLGYSPTKDATSVQYCPSLAASLPYGAPPPAPSLHGPTQWVPQFGPTRGASSQRVQRKASVNRVPLCVSSDGPPPRAPLSLPVMIVSMLSPRCCERDVFDLFKGLHVLDILFVRTEGCFVCKAYCVFASTKQVVSL